MTADATGDRGVRWMLAWQAGDEAAFDRLVEAYSGPVYSLLTRFLGGASVREDLVQEVFLRVLRSRLRYRPTARFSTWLYRIAYNLCVNERESRARREGVLEPLAAGDGGYDQDPADPDQPEPWRQLERDDLVSLVRSALGRLPERQRMALLLARYEGLSLAEIGEVLGISEPAAKSTVHRARERLRRELAPLLPEEQV